MPIPVTIITKLLKLPEMEYGETKEPNPYISSLGLSDNFILHLFRPIAGGKHEHLGGVELGTVGGSRFGNDIIVHSHTF